MRTSVVLGSRPACVMSSDVFHFTVHVEIYGSEVSHFRIKCAFIHTTRCVLSEITRTDPEGAYALSTNESKSYIHSLFFRWLLTLLPGGAGDVLVCASQLTRVIQVGLIPHADKSRNLLNSAKYAANYSCIRRSSVAFMIVFLITVFRSGEDRRSTLYMFLWTRGVDRPVL